MTFCCAPAPLTAEEAACLADATEALMGQTCDVVRRVPTGDGAGGQSQAWTVVTSSVPCSVTALGGGASGIGGGERDSDGRWETAVAYRLSLPATADVRASDRVQVEDIVMDVTAVLHRWGVGTLKVEAAQVTP